jgi:predicted PurR-regulated permease PerM
MTQPVTSPSPSPRRDSFVPPLVRAASEWTWRLLILGAGLIALFFVVSYFSQIVVPLAIGLLLCALLSAVHQRLSRIVPRAAAAAITVVGTLLVILGLLTLVGSQISGGMSDMARQVSDGIQQIRDFIRNSLGISDDQLGEYVDQARQWLANANLGSRLSSAGVTAGHFVAGIFIALFSLFFFLFDGPRIWAYLVRLFPRSARPYVDSSGTVAWEQLTHYVRATVLVAAVDAVGITAGALILRVPFAIAIGVLVFLLSVIPIVGALSSGAVAVLIALVAQGPVSALIMLAVVVAVQQLESHVLQPFILGRSVRIHPVAVIAAIACGAIVAGIVGTLVAVPILAVVKAVANHLFEEYNQHEGITDEPGVGPPPATPGVSDAPAAQNRAEAEAGGSPTRGSGDPPPHT